MVSLDTDMHSTAGAVERGKSSTHLNLLVLRCKDIEKSKKFYEKLKLVFIKEQHGKGAIHYSTSIGNLVIELYPLTQDIADNTRLGFSINTDNIEEYLKDNKIEIDSKYTFNNIVTSVVKDPDGRKVELSCLYPTVPIYNPSKK